MANFEEVKRAVFAHFKTCMPKNINVIEKLTQGKELSLSEVDDLIDSLGKYHAFIICLRQHAKA